MLISGCIPNNSTSKCPDKPVGSLDSKNVKNIQLSSQMTTETGQVRQDKYVGYTFTANAGQKLTYQTNDDICTWVYAPNIDIINSKDLSQTGKYTIQIAAPQGVRNFELKLGLDIIQPLASNAEIPKPIRKTKPETTTEPTPEITTENRIEPEKFVRDHYISLNNREYNQTWHNLSQRFQNEVGSYSQYEEWWNKVREIRIGNITSIKQSKNTAIVDADLWYFMNDGKDFKDTNNRIYLIWSYDSKTWLFYRKSPP